MKTLWTVVLLFVVLLPPEIARADHIPWMDKYGCCGEKNCLSATVSKKSDEGDVIVNGLSLKIRPSAVHKSETVYGWYCWRLIEKCMPPKDSVTVPQEIISEKCALCAFYEGRAGNF